MFRIKEPWIDVLWSQEPAANDKDFGRYNSEWNEKYSQGSKQLRKVSSPRRGRLGGLNLVKELIEDPH